MADWRNAEASVALVGEVNARWPGRDRSSDGTIGDAAHATRKSDHNPWVKDARGQGVVRARDVDKDGIDAGWLAEHLRKLGAAGDPRLRGGGYVIWNARITKPDFSGWKAYTGSNPHTHHLHVSLSQNAAGYDSKAGWGISGAAPAAGGRRTLRLQRPYMTGDDVRAVQRAAGVKADGVFGPNTEAGVKRYQQAHGLAADGVVGPKTRAAMRL